ncbi:hypothetical protein NBO_402g0001 [Nosema bombycis CQ1]|uniref:Uncharacterized protein n=1 Tax=Nosema bombycis (strain CQ1 / CVCC 102059) TaxID=578461 RepID=R0MIE6_NOSB1|nr:hypothetical protein NBO_402g0001 [Nosema bombycis CQ1]|eukprot:EOB12583.1 hypothetical protein NBO_402g0001 [Nosema bombycis CQ1]
MLNFIIFKYSYQLILCGLTFTPEFFYLSPLGMCLFFLLRRLRTRIRYFIGCLLLLLSFYYPLIYPVTYGFIQCNTYTSVRTLLLSDLKYDLSRIVIFLELISYLLRSFIGFSYVYLLFVIEIYNLIHFC